MALEVPQISRALCALGLTASLILTGLGGCGGNDEPEAPLARETASRPAPPLDSFPRADGKTLGEVVDEADPPQPADPVVTALTQVFDPGDSRFAFLLADRDHHEITDAEVALYIAPISAKGGDPYEAIARGPFPAKLVSLGTTSEFRSDSTLDNPFSATAFYLAELPFLRPGDWRVEALIRNNGRLIAKSLPRVVVGGFEGIPARGDRPPRINTPTTESVDGDSSQLSTRRPPGDLFGLNFANLLDEKPVALLFTTPGFCQSRICGPVSDVAEQVASEFQGQVEVVGMEIYNANDPDRGVRRQVRRFNLPSDTWLFVIGADGVVRRAIEGPFGVDEMRGWLEEASHS